MGFFSKVGSFFKNTASKVSTAVKSVGSKVSTAVKSVGSKVSTAVKNVASKASTVVKGAIDGALQGSGGGIAGIIAGAVGGATNALTAEEEKQADDYADKLVGNMQTVESVAPSAPVTVRQASDASAPVVVSRSTRTTSTFDRIVSSLKAKGYVGYTALLGLNSNMVGV